MTWLVNTPDISRKIVWISKHTLFYMYKNDKLLVSDSFDGSNIIKYSKEKILCHISSCHQKHIIYRIVVRMIIYNGDPPRQTPSPTYVIYEKYLLYANYLGKKDNFITNIIKKHLRILFHRTVAVHSSWFQGRFNELYNWSGLKDQERSTAKIV